MEPRKIFPARQRGQHCRRMPAQAGGFALPSIGACDIWGAASVIHHDSWRSLAGLSQWISAPRADGFLLNAKQCTASGEIYGSPQCFFLTQQKFGVLWLRGRIALPPKGFPAGSKPFPQEQLKHQLLCSRSKRTLLSETLETKSRRSNMRKFI